MANYFARYIMCPIPVLIAYGIDSLDYIESKFCVSHEVAIHVRRNIDNRKKFHGNEIFKYEIPLLKIIDRDDLLKDSCFFSKIGGINNNEPVVLDKICAVDDQQSILVYNGKKE